MKHGGHLTKPGWSKPHTHSNTTNLALFRHKITRGLILLQGAQMGAGGSWAPPSTPLTLTTGLGFRVRDRGLYSQKVVNGGRWYDDRIMGVRPAIAIHETYFRIRTIVVNSSVNLRHTCSCRTANRKSTLPHYHWCEICGFGVLVVMMLLLTR